MQIMKTLPARILAAVLLLQALAYYAVASRSERIPAASPLADFPRSIAGWTVEREFPLEKEVQDVWSGDDRRVRLNAVQGVVGAQDVLHFFFETQRYGQTPHSPKNCL